MIYEVSNHPKRLNAEVFDSAVSFACGYLGIEEEFTIEFDTLDKHQCGYCDYDDEEIVVTIARRLSQAEIIRTLFHELVHVKQYIDGRLENCVPQRWMGIEMDEEYEQRPWEIEAFALEEKMMDQFYGRHKSS